MAGLAGELGLAAILASAVLLGVRSFSPRSNLRAPAAVMLLAAVVAFLALEAALLLDDFSLAYVAANHASTAPLLGTISAAWAGLEGSLVLWLLVAAAIVYRVARTADPQDRPDRIVVGVLASIVGFFALITVIGADPFRYCTAVTGAICSESTPLAFWTAVAPAAGAGADPLLLNHPAMAFHPPLLYVGFLATAVPFARAVAALVTGDGTDTWLVRSHRWLLGSFVFLTVGMGIGAWWSYEVLGWGGYWGWDPVENAALLPWLAVVALLHSLPVQRRRGMLRSWNLGTALAAFSLVALATLLTRTSVVPSVHTFTRSDLGPPLLGFLVFVVTGSFGLLAFRAPRLASLPRLESALSREAVLVITGSILAALAAAVLAGTLLPMVVAAFSGAVVSVGAPYFDRTAAVAGLALIILMGFGTILPWRMATLAVLRRRLGGPVAAGFVAAALTAALGTRHSAVVVAVGIGTFVIAAAGWDLVTAVAGRRRSGGVLRTTGRVLAGDPSHWGGQLSHAGIALLAVAIVASTGLSERAEITIPPLGTATFSGYVLDYEAPIVLDQGYRLVEGVQISVRDAGGRTATLEPRFHRYPGYRLPVATPDLHRTLRGDLYLSLAGISDQGIVLDVFFFPLIWLLWTGGFVTAAGGVWSLLARRRDRSRSSRRSGSAIHG